MFYLYWPPFQSKNNLVKSQYSALQLHGILPWLKVKSIEARKLTSGMLSVSCHAFFFSESVAGPITCQKVNKTHRLLAMDNCIETPSCTHNSTVYIILFAGRREVVTYKQKIQECARIPTLSTQEDFDSSAKQQPDARVAGSLFNTLPRTDALNLFSFTNDFGIPQLK